MKLRDLLENIDFDLVQGDLDAEIRHFETDSRKAGKGDLFIALKGALADGHRFIPQTIDQGVSAILVEDVPENVPETVSVVRVEDARIASGLLAANYYDHPADSLKLIGITGTKGKTTTAGMIRAALNQAGIPCGTIGSDGALYGDVREYTPNTTPDGPTIQAIFRRMVDAGMQACVMEVSSQAFKLRRVAGITFDVGIFLNISPDHIGEHEHESYEEYLACKKQIFDQSKQMIVNRNGNIWDEMTKEQQDAAITYSVDGKADYYSTDYEAYREPGTLGCRYQLNGEITTEVILAVPGLFNVGNSMAAIAASHYLGAETAPVLEALRTFKTRGRAQVIPEAAKYGRTVLLDFAHNAVSFKNILTELRAYNPRRIIILFGLCSHETAMRGWDEGYNAGKYADFSIVTEDTEGSDPFDETMVDVIKGLDANNADYVVIPDRVDAIRYSLENSNEDDILIYIGRSIDIYRNVDGKEVPWLQETVVEETLKEIYEGKDQENDQD